MRQRRTVKDLLNAEHPLAALDVRGWVRTRRDAKDWIERDPDLALPEHRLLRRKLLRAFGEALGLVDVA